MGTRRIASDIATGAVAGYIGLAVMDQVTSRLYALASEADKQREKAASPGVADTVAARRTAALVGVQLDDSRADALGSVYHYLLGLGWAPIYLACRRLFGMPSLAAGLLTGLGLWAGFDEGLVPALGCSAPNRAYPLSTHLRGIFGHLAYGLTIMTTVEALRLGERSAQPERKRERDDDQAEGDRLPGREPTSPKRMGGVHHGQPANAIGSCPAG